MEDGVWVDKWRFCIILVYIGGCQGLNQAGVKKRGGDADGNI